MAKELNSKAVTSRHRCQSFWDFPCPFWHNLTLHPVSRCKRTQNSQKAVVTVTLGSFLGVKKPNANICRESSKGQGFSKVWFLFRHNLLTLWQVLFCGEGQVVWPLKAIKTTLPHVCRHEESMLRSSDCMVSLKSVPNCWTRALVWKGLTITVIGHNI